MPDERTDEAPTPAPTPEAPPPTAPERVAAHHLDAGHHHGHAQLPPLRFLEEIKRRNVGRVAILYIVISYVVLEVFEMFFHLLEMPPWTGRAAVLFAVLGFPIALLVAWAYEITPEGLKPTDEVPPLKSIAVQTGRRLDRAIIVVLGIALSYFVADKFWLSKHSAPATAFTTPEVKATPVVAAVPEKSVAVLPFLDMSEKHDQEYFSDGLSEELINMLTKVPDLRVPARTSSFYFKGKQTTIKDIAAALGVSHVLEGSVRKSGNALRITAQLIRVDNGYHMWSETYDRKLDDVFKMQDEIAKAVVIALKASLGESGVPTSVTTQNAEAYRLYLLGRAINRSATTTAQFKTAAEYMRQATRLDPLFAQAWAWIAFTLQNAAAFANVHTDATIAEMRRATRKALDLAPNLASAHRASGLFHYAVEWDWAAAVADFQKSYDLDPTDANNALSLAETLSKTRGDSEAELSLLQKAGSLDPVNEAVLEDLAWYYTTAGHLDTAESTYRKAIDLLPAEPGLHAGLGEILILRGQPMNALAEYQRDVEPSNRRQGAALAYFALSRKSEADAALSEMMRVDAISNAAGIAQVFAYRGESDKAFEWLERAYKQRDLGVTSANVEPLFRSLRSDRRWKPFLRKLKLPEQPIQ